jgi:predicted permease
VSVRRFLTRARWDDERARELESYVAIETDENVARGMTRDEARAAALRKLGNQTLVREDIYHMNTVAFVDNVWRDLKFGARLLRLNPGFALVAILSLALGIGANTAIFQLLDAVRIRTLPVRDPQQLVEIRIVKTREGRSGNFHGRNAAMTHPLWEELRSRPLPFATRFAWGTTTFELASGGESQPAAGLWVSGDFFAGLGVGPLLGRVIATADDQRGCGAPGAVLSYAFWQRRYGGDASVIGRTIALNGHATEIIGVTPANFYGVEVGRVFDLAVPICAEPVFEPERGALDKRHFWWLAVMARLEPGVTIERASAQLAAASPSVFADTVPQNYTPQTAKDYQAFQLGAVPAGTGVSAMRREYETPLWMLLSIAGLVLLIACGNLANLMLARASARQREIAVRLAIGASRGRLIRQLLAESALMAAVGAALGIVLAGRLERVLLSFFENTWLFLDLRPDWRVMAFTVAVAAITCLIFGAMPALRATGIGPGAAMKSASRGLSDSRERFGLRRLLVVAQVALSLVLVVGAGLFVRTLQNLTILDAGFQRDGVLVADLDIRPLRLPSAREPAFQRELLDRVRAIPGVEAAATTFVVPVSGMGWNDRVVIDGIVHKESANFNRVSPGFFKTLGIPLLAGRDFTDRDAPWAEAAVIVSESFVRMFIGDRDPIGRTFTIEVGPGEHSPLYHVIGVSRDTKYSELREDFTPLAFVMVRPDDRPTPFVSEEIVLIRSRVGLSGLISAVTRTAADIDPRILGDFQSMTTQVGKTLMRERLMAVLSGFFGALAALLATIGLYGVMSYTVARRRNEIGIRMALGAERGDVVRMVLREAAMLLAAGVVVGAVLAIAAAQTAKGLLFGLTPADPTTLFIAIAGLGLVAMAASYVPALRASRLEPTEALRDE